MTTYAILIPGNEQAWADAAPEAVAAMYARHGQFAEMLAERGHKLTGGAELTASSQAKVVRGGDSVTVTDGPYAESVEQLSGLYLVDSDDLDDLLEVVGFLAGAEGALEVRPTVDHSGL